MSDASLEDKVRRLVIECNFHDAEMRRLVGNAELPADVAAVLARAEMLRLNEDGKAEGYDPERAARVVASIKAWRILESYDAARSRRKSSTERPG